MARLRFVHAADLHLDSPFKGLRAAVPDHVASALYNATFEAYENIVDLRISEKVDALLVAGDIYDRADRSLRAQRKFVDGLERLHAAGIRSFVCHMWGANSNFSRLGRVASTCSLRVLD